MKAFIAHWDKEIKPYIHNPADKELAEYWWRAALEMANKLFLDGMHPQDVIFAIQKELEDK